MKIKIALAESRFSKRWKNIEMSTDEFTRKLEGLLHSSKKQFTMAQYRQMTKTEKDKAKDGIGFICGQLKVNCSNRHIKNIDFRTGASLDADYAKKDTLDRIHEILKGLEYVVYSTLSHTEENPRLRIIIFYNRNVTPDECQAISRRIAERIGIEIFDDTTFQSNRLMYAPTCCADADPIFIHNRGNFLNVDEILATYADWTDTSSWPVSERVTKAIKKGIETKQENPMEKQGIVGAFCRVYNIHEAIETFLSDKYEKCSMGDRYTYIGGSTSAGLIVYDDLFAYSHHSTDPANNGHIHNAFDLVRIHKFGDLDKDKADDKASNKSMREFANLDENIKKAIIKEEFENSGCDFTEEDQKGTDEWLETSITPNGIVHKIKETEFIDDLQSKRDYYYVNGEMYDKNGQIKDGVVKKEIQLKIERFIKQGQARKVDDLYKALCLKAYYEPPAPAPDEIHFKNISLRITNDGFKEIDPPKFVITRIGYDFEPDRKRKDIKKWVNFLNCLLEPEDIMTVQEYIGYCLVPTTKAQKALFIKSGGGEGKSILVYILQKLFDASSIKDKLQSLVKNQFKLATLENKLIFMDDDLNTEGLPDTGLWKSAVTNTGKMTIEKKGKDSRDADIFTRFFCIGNSDVTSLFDHSDAFYDRIMPLTTRGIKFRGSIHENKNLKDELIQEIPGIINWALEGLFRLHKNKYNFTISERTKSNLKSMILNNDNVAAFLESGYLEFGLKYTSHISDINRAYQKWCEDNGEIPKNGFAKYFKQLILNDKKYNIIYFEKLPFNEGSKKRGRGYKGVKIIDEIINCLTFVSAMSHEEDGEEWLN